jgi:hypothetical protein
MTSAKGAFDPCLYIAYIFLLFSYLTTNVLILRLNLVLSAIAFIVWSCIYPATAVQVDTVVYNSLFIIINLYNSIPLFKELLPVSLTTIEEESYQRDFKDFLSRREFKYFISHFKKNESSPEQPQIVNKGTKFEGLIYVAKINKGSEIFIIKDNEKVKSLREGAWLGVVEYMLYHEKKIKSDELMWDVSAIIESGKGLQNSETQIISLNRIGIEFYVIDLPTLFKLYDDHDYPFIFKNALQALWLIYTTNYIIEQDLELIRFRLTDEKLLKSKYYYIIIENSVVSNKAVNIVIQDENNINIETDNVNIPSN